MTIGLNLFRVIKLQSETCLKIFSDIPVTQIDWKKIKISDHIEILSTEVQDDCLICHITPIDVTKDYFLEYLDVEYSILPDALLDSFLSDKQLGLSLVDGLFVFRLFAPRASQVKLETFATCDGQMLEQYEMIRDGQGVWEVSLKSLLASQYYRYRIYKSKNKQNNSDSTVVIGDPYSKAVVTENNYSHAAKTLILKDNTFDWEGDTWICRKPSDLIIYEMHIRDMTIHKTSQIRSDWQGTYLGLTDKTAFGGINYIKQLGVNAVELLPVQEFANYEVDYKSEKTDVFNYWNPYARNHWGYMTSYFFAPESYYATGNSLEPGKICGETGNAVQEFKTMVKSFHQNKISVIMDVVYNHVSQYDLNPFKLIDKNYYFRLDDEGNYLSDSYCGNDFKTERPMTRKLIVDSLKCWMTEYHIDGFRFDLAAMIDEMALDDISRELREVNPDVILIAEPWGGNQYDLKRFSIRGWSSWNDHFRNGIKGQNAHTGVGYLFGHWYHNDDWTALKRYMLGSTVKENGPFEESGHSVNYLESHDDLTLGDFIRIASGEFNSEKAVTDLPSHLKLTPKQLKLSKLAALILMTSQGSVMMHAGQEFARSKVIAATDAPAPKVGFIDHDTYNKDDETNWINYDHVKVNQLLFEYYRGLIKIRKYYSILQQHDSAKIHCWGSFNFFGFAMHLVDQAETDILVLLNSHSIESSGFDLPKGQWTLIVNEHEAGIQPIGKALSGHIEVPPVSGMILIRNFK